MAENQDAGNQTGLEEESGAQEPLPPKKKEEECPRCDKGAPAWMATFADMATLLMAFFVLILSFSSVNVPRFEQVAGSLKLAFGIKRVVAKISIPMAETILVSTFTLSEAAPTVLPQPTQSVVDPSRRNVKQMKGLNEAAADIEAEYQQVLEAMEYEVEQGQVVVSIQGEEIVVEVIEDSADNSDATDSSLGNGGRISQQTLEIALGVNEVASEITSEIVVKRQNQGLAKAEGLATEAASKYEAIRAELSEQIEQGLAEVERDGDSVIIRLGQQDSFSSGSAALQSGFEDTLISVGDALSNTGGQVRVEGHTDNVPVAFSERFRSNWDLSSARSAAVANFLLDNSQLQPGRVTITGLADSEPIADNSTAAGRAQNRRIEVIVDG